MGGLLDLPIAFAFSAGMVATVNPCGFAMLPAYVAYQLGADDPHFADSPLWARGARGLALGVVATLGFVILFATIGAIVSLGGRMIVRAIPWAALLIGLGLVVLGLVMLAGRALYVSAFSRYKLTWSPGWRGVFLFGLAYGVASLSCTLPIFLVVVGSSVATAGVVGSLGMFVAYAMGMGSVLTAVTIGAALFKGAVARFLKRVVPYVERASAVLLIGAGLYITTYWVTNLR
jgi:cytochrome c-type biogenesis protein